MSALVITFENAEVLQRHGFEKTPLSIAEGLIVEDGAGRAIDLTGYHILPGIVDLHGDGFERHLAPRRGAVKDLQSGFYALHSELASNGITTAVLAQFYSWEGGMRGPDFAREFLEHLKQFAPKVPSTLLPQLRFETHMLDHYTEFAALCARYAVPYVVFNDHLPHQALAKGKRPARLTGQALKSGRSPEAHLELLKALHEKSDHVALALPDLIAALGAGVLLGSHDDAHAQDRQGWAAKGAALCEFPETKEAAEAAAALGNPVIMGAPNVVRGGSHKKNISALELIQQGLCSALASDYHYPSPRLAALALAKEIGLPAAWQLVSSGPAAILGLKDRGHIKAGYRADLLILDAKSQQVAACFAGGALSYMSGDLAQRFFGS